MSFRNRCRILGAAGIIDLSIPLAGGRDQKTLMKEVRIAADKGWQDRHWKTIVSCYSRSPWFDHYREQLERIYQRSANFLIDWNLICLEWALNMLGMGPAVSLTETYKKEYSQAEGLDWRGKIVPLAGQPGHLDNGEIPHYRQVFEERIGFIPDCSILDLLFCEGKNAIRYIRS